MIAQSVEHIPQALGIYFADGSFLSVLTIEDLHGFNCSLDDLHARAFLAARDSVLQDGALPADFFQYKVNVCLLLFRLFAMFICVSTST